MLFQMACRSASRLQEEFHFHSGELDHVVILERVRRGADLLAIDGGPVGPFHMRDEVALRPAGQHRDPDPRSEEHTSELQSRLHLVCRLLLEKKKKNNELEHKNIMLQKES